MNGIAERLKLIRKSLNLNQEDFSNKYKISRQALSRYETGRADISDELKIKLLEDGYSINWLLLGKGEMFMDNTFEETTGSEIVTLVNDFVQLNKDDRNKTIDFVKSLKQK